MDDRAELQAGRVVVDERRIGAGRDLVGAGNRNELDVDLHAGGFRRRRRGAQAREGNEPPKEVSGYGSANDAY